VDSLFGRGDAARRTCDVAEDILEAELVLFHIERSRLPEPTAGRAGKKEPGVPKAPPPALSFPLGPPTSLEGIRSLSHFRPTPVMVSVCAQVFLYFTGLLDCFHAGALAEYE